MIVSPCIKVCVIDPARNICAGCGRTLDEIARWGSMGDGERAAIMRELGARASGRASAAEPPNKAGLEARGPSKETTP